MPDTCEHRVIETLVLSKNYTRHKDGTTTHEGDVAMWACADCKVRFYPACPVCVVDGHRNGHHPSGPFPEGPQTVTAEDLNG